MTAKILDLASARAARAARSTSVGTVAAPADLSPELALALLVGLFGQKTETLAAAPAPATYAPPAETRGEKFDRSLSTVEIAKRGRAEIKALIASGALPKGTKVSVRAESFSMGTAIRVKVVAFPTPVLSVDRLEHDLSSPHAHVYEMDCPRYRPEARAALELISGVFAAYNRDASDSQTDHFDVNFYGGDASFGWELERDERAAYAALRAELPLPL